jgi:hypothetical protein
MLMTNAIGRRRFLDLSLVSGAGLLAAGAARTLPGAEAAPANGAGELLVGAASVSITPDRPVPLHGQMHTRISKSVESPVMAEVLALESRQGERVIDQAVFVSCDVAVLRDGIIDVVRQRIKPRLTGFDTGKLIASATHTHSAPTSIEGVYELPKEGIMRPAEYFEFLAGRLAEGIVKAWQSRGPGKAGWGLGHAVVGQNRRSVYADGHAQMYGKTNVPEFRGFEGYEDHGLEVLCFWDRNDKLLATAVNVACPAQEVEGNLAVSADYWHEVRKRLRARHGDGLVVLGWIGAAGDQSPHLMYRQKGEERMRQLRGLTRLEEIARRVDLGWQEAYEGASKDKRSDVVLAHRIRSIELPPRMVTEKECAQAKASLKMATSALKGWHQRVVDRYEQQQAGHVEPYTMELHAVRVGDVAIATNDFELFTDYGIQIKARSSAVQTFVIQLAGAGSYLPTERAVRGGGYSAIVQSNRVGPPGGQILVDRSVELINSMWPKPKNPAR